MGQGFCLSCAIRVPVRRCTWRLKHRCLFLSTWVSARVSQGPPGSLKVAKVARRRNWLTWVPSQTTELRFNLKLIKLSILTILRTASYTLSSHPKALAMLNSSLAFLEHMSEQARDITMRGPWELLVQLAPLGLLSFKLETIASVLLLRVCRADI